MVKAKNESNADDFRKYSKKFLEIIDLSDEILGSSEEFMVGNWINDARDVYKRQSFYCSLSYAGCSILAFL